MLTYLLALLTLGAVSKAQAFSDTEKFALSPLEGGGGGRFFTGSPADGFTCAVCHRGGATPNAFVRGLPVDGYTPLETYEVEVTFDQLDKSHAISLELLSKDGRGAGEVELLNESELDGRSHCDQDLTLSNASYLTAAAGRTIVGLADCGAGALRFRFTAPDEPVIAFSLAMVVSDGEGDSEGDGTLHVARLLRRVGERPSPVEGAVTCSAAATRPTRGVTWLAWLLLIAAWLRWRVFSKLGATILVVALALPGCARVAPYERGTLARRDMALGADGDVTAGEEHAIAYREGSSGGGSAQGGGCGCN
jgi:hypothetical protein